MTFKDVTRKRTLAAHIWYPTDKKIPLIPIAQTGNPFIPVVSALDAPLAGSDKFPLVYPAPFT